MKMNCESDYKILAAEIKEIGADKLIEKYDLGISKNALLLRLGRFRVSGKITDTEYKNKGHKMLTREQYVAMCRSMTRAEIISKCGIPNYYITKLIKEHNISPMRTRNGFHETRETKKKCIRMIEKGYSNVDIATQLGRSIAYVTATRAEIEFDPSELPIYSSMPDEIRSIVIGSWIDESARSQIIAKH